MAFDVFSPFGISLTQSSIKETIGDARGDDIDLFGKILITAMMGIDEAKGWLLIRGGSL